MRLLTKTTLYFLGAMAVLLAMAGAYLFRQFSRELNNRSDKELIGQEIEWIQYLETEAGSGTTFILRARDLSIFPVGAVPDAYPVITDSYDYIAGSDTRIPYRQLSQVVSVEGVSYRILIRKSEEQKAALVTNVTRTMLFVFAGLFAATLIFNWVMSKRLWKPFQRSLLKIRGAELEKMEAIRFDRSDTLEFDELNASLNGMTAKIYSDYMNMKEFTENAAHEMQTPLAIAQSKLELMLQDGNLSDEQVRPVLDATEALNRLSKLNQNLLLLAKIGNNQYETSDEVSLRGVIEKYLHLFYEFIREKRLLIETSLEKDFVLKMHPLLADSLVSNLLGNAIKYNYDGGNIRIALTSGSFLISNTSMLDPIDPQRVFTRFHTSAGSGVMSNGLGLAIVKKIVDSHKLGISYQSENGVNYFLIKRT